MAVTLTDLLLTGVIGVLLYRWYRFRRILSKIDSIPTVGSDSWIGAFLSSWKYLFDDGSLIQLGYTKYPGTMFKLPTFTTKTGWMIFVKGQELIEELRKAPVDVLSFADSAGDTLQTEAVLGHHAKTPDFHIDIVRNPLTRALPLRFADVHDEVVESCKEYLPAGQDWVSLRLHDASLHIVSRTSNRLFVGLPLCREPEYIRIQKNWTINFIVGGHIVHQTPWIFQPVVKYMLQSKLSSSTKKVEQYLGPIIAERLQMEANHGPDWEGKPNDAISWLLDAAPQGYRTNEDITTKIMLINLAAIHTSSITATNVLFDLAARQEYIKPLREEIEEVTHKYGWTKEAMGHLLKTESFIKESGRLSSLVSMSVVRKARKDFRLSNGITIPAGYTVGAPTCAVHTDSDIYEDPHNFNGFRFVDTGVNKAKAVDVGNDLSRNQTQMVSLDSSFLFFGLGRNACPGRFFAVNEAKIILAHILLNYDIKLHGDATEVPLGRGFGASRSPDPVSQLSLRKRKME